MKLLVLLNHPLNDIQIKELKEQWGVNDIVYLSPENAKRLANITKDNYETNIEEINKEVRAVLRTLKCEAFAVAPNLMLIQGHSALVYNIIINNTFVTPIFALSERKSSEFQHICFMQY